MNQPTNAAALRVQQAPGPAGAMITPGGAALQEALDCVARALTADRFANRPEQLPETTRAAAEAAGCGLRRLAASAADLPTAEQGLLLQAAAEVTAAALRAAVLEPCFALSEAAAQTVFAERLAAKAVAWLRPPNPRAPGMLGELPALRSAAAAALADTACDLLERAASKLPSCQGRGGSADQGAVLPQLAALGRDREWSDTRCGSLIPRLEASIVGAGLMKGQGGSRLAAELVREVNKAVDSALRNLDPDQPGLSGRVAVELLKAVPRLLHYRGDPQGVPSAGMTQAAVLLALDLLRDFSQHESCAALSAAL